MPEDIQNAVKHDESAQDCYADGYVMLKLWCHASGNMLESGKLPCVPSTVIVQFR